MNYNAPSTNFAIQYANKDNISMTVRDYSSFATIDIVVANHRITLFIKDTSQVADVLRLFAKPTYEIAEEA